MQHRRPRKVVWIVGLMSLTIGASAGDRDAGWYQKQFEQWGAAIASLKAADRTQAMTQEIEHVRTLIGQAQAYLASENFEQIDPVLVRIGTEVEYVRAKAGRIEAERLATLAEQEAKAAEQEAQTTRKAAEDAAKRRKDLEAKGL